jgi:hypothetical protein
MMATWEKEVRPSEETYGVPRMAAPLKVLEELGVTVPYEPEVIFPIFEEVWDEAIMSFLDVGTRGNRTPQQKDDAKRHL